VDILHLATALRVKVDDALACWRGGRLLKVRVQPREQRVGAAGDAVALVGCLGAVRGVHLLVERRQGAEEALGDAMLLVQGDGALKARVGDEVAVGEVLCEDSGARLLLLCDLVRVAVGVGGGRAVVVVVGLAGGDGDFGGAELGVVEEEGRPGSGFLFEGDGGALCLAFGGDVDGGDLAAGFGLEMGLG
jgi:hypothetical protein